MSDKLIVGLNIGARAARHWNREIQELTTAYIADNILHVNKADYELLCKSDQNFLPRAFVVEVLPIITVHRVHIFIMINGEGKLDVTASRNMSPFVFM